jgi:hypothetical protein
MDMDQLAQELAMLKAESEGMKQEKRLGGFIDKYGTKFNGNTDIANLILAEMDRRGVNEASEAASEAVQNVLDRLREEATVILDETKGALAEISSLVDKIDGIEQAVDAATAGGGAPAEEPISAGPEAGAPPPAGPEGAPEMPPPGAGAEMPPPGPEAGAPEMPPPGPEAAPPGPEAPPEAAPPGAEAGAPEMPPPAPPPGVPSDARLKAIKGKFAAYKQQRAAPQVPSDARIKAWKPSPGVLQAVRGFV